MNILVIDDNLNTPERFKEQLEGLSIIDCEIIYAPSNEAIDELLQDINFTSKKIIAVYSDFTIHREGMKVGDFSKSILSLLSRGYNVHIMTGGDIEELPVELRDLALNLEGQENKIKVATEHFKNTYHNNKFSETEQKL